MSHTSFIKVRGYHLDVYQHVNNASYLEFLEDARWEYLEDSGDIEFFQAKGFAWVIVNINISYRASATMGQTLEITTWLSNVGNKSAVFSQRIADKATGKTVVEADITFVILDQNTGQALPIEGEIRERMAKHLSEQPEV